MIIHFENDLFHTCLYFDHFMSAKLDFLLCSVTFLASLEFNLAGLILLDHLEAHLHLLCEHKYYMCCMFAFASTFSHQFPDCNADFVLSCYTLSRVLLFTVGFITCYFMSAPQLMWIAFSCWWNFLVGIEDCDESQSPNESGGDILDCPQSHGPNRQWKRKKFPSDIIDYHK